ncbi:hypothetical protein JXA47_13025 [Candidatus Sumerlaeota bacterium]|nr:hypothetical protein [Candidatus Sumerlaeota bacterium]
MSFPAVSLPLAHGFVIGDLEWPHLGEGWWDRMVSPDRPGLHHRTSKRCAHFRLLGQAGQRELRMLLSASVTLIGGPAWIEVLASSEGNAPRTLGTLEIAWEDWAVHALACPVESEGPIHFELRSLTPYVPHHTLHNGDHREMGVHLAAAHLC